MTKLVVPPLDQFIKLTNGSVYLWSWVRSARLCFTPETGAVSLRLPCRELDIWRHCAILTLVTSDAPWPGAGEHYVTMVTRDIITICTGNVNGRTPRGKVETRARYKEKILQKNKCFLWPYQGELEGERNRLWHWKDAFLLYMHGTNTAVGCYLLNYACSLFCSDQFESETSIVF